MCHPMCLQKARSCDRLLAVVRDSFPHSYASRLLPPFRSSPAPYTSVSDKALKKARRRAMALCVAAACLAGGEA